jgi:hypothetical protein
MSDKVEVIQMPIPLFKKEYRLAWDSRDDLGPMLQRGEVCIDGLWRQWRTTRFSTVLIGNAIVVGGDTKN